MKRSLWRDLVGLFLMYCIGSVFAIFDFVSERLWWVLGSVFLLFCVGFVFATYRFGWSATGFLNKSLWDWLQLLIVPLVLAVVALVFQLANSRTERQIVTQRYDLDREIAKQRYEQDQQIALDKQLEDVLQVYLDHMSELLLKESLRTSPSEEVRNVARVRTITVLTQLNARRIGYVFAFLREAGLMSTTANSSVVSLKYADLRSVNWSQVNLSNANLSNANLSNANLNGAYLWDANLTDAYLKEANLRGTNFTGVKLTGVNLMGANLSNADLRRANLSRANLSNASLTGTRIGKADFSYADLSFANLSGADQGAYLNSGILLTSRADEELLPQPITLWLWKANLSCANLTKVNLSGANLSGANLMGANLSNADLSGANLKGVIGVIVEELEKQAKSLEGAIMPDGSKHP